MLLPITKTKSMIPSNNIFIGGGDPLLGGTQNVSIDSRMQEIDRLKTLIGQKEQSLEQLKAQISQENQQSVSNTPVWDEIDRTVQGLSDREFEIIANDDEFIESNKEIEALVQSAFLEMMRPVVEKTPKGKDALESHLALVRRLKKNASNVVNKQISDFQEYTEKYSNMTYADYLKMKNETLKSNKS